MARRGDSVGGILVLGLVATGIGVLAVDYAFSPPEESMIDQLLAKISGKAPETPSEVAQTTAPSHAQVGPSQPGSAVILEVQKTLNGLGAHLKVDGVFGTETGKAIGAFQSAHHLPVTGQLDAHTIDAIGAARDAARRHPALRKAKSPKTVAKPPVTYRRAPPPPYPLDFPATISPEMVKEASNRLSALLHVQLPSTGQLTHDLSTVISNFQHAMGLPATGSPDAATLSRLRAQSGGVTRTGADAGDWHAETSSLGPAAQAVIQKVIDSGDARDAQSLSAMLGKAGLSQAAQAVQAKAAKTVTTGTFMLDDWFQPGFSPEPEWFW
jgi:peptidoglycan hydrolase-like protein with peptidoglycan-binding domain